MLVRDVLSKPLQLLNAYKIIVVLCLNLAGAHMNNRYNMSENPIFRLHLFENTKDILPVKMTRCSRVTAPNKQ